MLKTISFLFLVVGLMIGAAVTIESSTAQLPAAQTGSLTKPRELVLDLGNKVMLKLIEIPAGKFTMGSSDGEKKTAVAEAMAGEMEESKAVSEFATEVEHEVTISKPFFMAITHVTVDQFAQFVEDSGAKTDAETEGWALGYVIEDGKLEVKRMVGASWRNPGFAQKGTHPVVQVSWNDAMAFCAWLSKKTGKSVVLPTEAQWEYACRAGTKTAYPWGDNLDDGKGWVNAADARLKKEIPKHKGWPFFSWDDGFAFTSPVASFKANSFGLYDMIGNAAHWCSDRSGAIEKKPATDPTGPAAGKARVLRGSAWDFHPRYCRSAYRDWGVPTDRGADTGFRVVVVGESK